MLAARTTSPHLSVSSAMNLPNSAGELDGDHFVLGQEQAQERRSDVEMNAPVARG